MEILFYRHQTKGQRINGTCTIYHRITINGVRGELYSTHLDGKHADFDREKQRFRASDKDYLYKNGRLNEIEGNLLEIYTTLSRRRKPFTPQMLKEMYMSQTDEITFMDVFDRWLKEVQADNNRTKSTKKAYKNVRNKVLEFLIYKQRQLDPMETFDLDTLLQYRAWLKKIPFEDSTVRKHLATIKQLTIWAKINKLVPHNLLDGFKIPHERPKPHVYLTVPQFELLRAHEFSNEKLQRVADVFVVYCRTGFHWKDLKEMAKIGEDTYQKAGEYQFINWNRGKTGMLAQVPVNAWPEVNEVVSKYGGWQKLPILSNQKMNDYLKLVAAELNVEIMKIPTEVRQAQNLAYLPEKLTVKAGRKTLADWLLNELCWTREAVRVVLGLKTDKCLDSYVREDERRVLRELRRGESEKRA